MNAQYLRTIPTIREFFKIDETKELQEGVRLLLEAMTEITIPSGSVIISVAGQATGTPNPSPISNDIS